MEKEIQKEDIEKLESLKSEFLDIHQKISEVEKKMKDLSQEANTLTEKLKNTRKEEELIIDLLGSKYGEGSLDPFKMKWILK